MNPLSFPPYTVFYRLLAPLPLHGLFSIYLYAVFRLFCTSLFPYFHQGKFRNLIKYGGVERTNGSTRRIHQTTMGWVMTYIQLLFPARLITNSTSLLAKDKTTLLHVIIAVTAALSSLCLRTPLLFSRERRTEIFWKKILIVEAIIYVLEKLVWKFYLKKFDPKYISCVLTIVFWKNHSENSFLEIRFGKLCFRNFEKHLMIDFYNR